MSSDDSMIISLPGNDEFATELANLLERPTGEVAMRHFPDGETYVRVDDDVTGRDITIVATLHRPDDKVLPLFFLAETLRELGASSVGLVAPYLAYMRQDRRFRPGEGITSRYFGAMVSRHVDWLVTVDPHLHRYESLSEIYSIPSTVVHAARAIADWIAIHVERPLLVGPDEESEQWVRDVADRAGAPHIVLQKTRHGDRDVDVSIPEVDRWTDRTPVLVDDIISTARTMIETSEHLIDNGLRPPTCIGVHGVFAEGAVEALRAVGARVVTTNTIPHPTNSISVAPLLADVLAARP